MRFAQLTVPALPGQNLRRPDPSDPKSTKKPLGLRPFETFMSVPLTPFPLFQQKQVACNEMRKVMFVMK